MNKKIEKIIACFAVLGEILNIKKTGCGHINDTYRVEMDTKEIFLLQRINHFVFKDVDGLMQNINNVTGYLVKKIIIEGGDPYRETLNLIPTKEGNSYLIYENNYYRLFRFISDSVSIESRPSLKEVQSAGNAYALFIKRLWDFDAKKLTEIIPDFHNTVKRFKDFEKTLEKASSERIAVAKDDIDFVLDNKPLASSLMEMIKSNKIGLHVTHNDTKLTNVLFDSSGTALAVIDLDTVMAGTPLYDFGDSIRSICNSAAEDEKNIEKVYFDEDLFSTFARGYLEVMGSKLNECEKSSLTLAAIVMTFECGMRFLGDYLLKNVYFKVEYDTHNLVRARTQFKLVKDMLKSKNKLDKIIEDLTR